MAHWVEVYTQMTNQTSPSARWIIRLHGEEMDIDACERRLDRRFDPRIDHIPHNGQSIRVLRSSVFDNLQDATDVLENATGLVAWLNGALSLAVGAEPLAIRDVGKIGSDGSIGFFNFARANLAGRGMMLAASGVIGNPNVAPVPAPSWVQKLMSAAENDDDVARVLKHFGQPTNWYDLWTTYEIIEDEVSQSTPRGMRPPRIKGIKPKRALMMSRKWISDSDLEKFADSCNYHRHGARKPPTPSESATPNEARQVLAQILRNWLSIKVP